MQNTQYITMHMAHQVSTLVVSSLHAVSCTVQYSDTLLAPVFSSVVYMFFMQYTIMLIKTYIHTCIYMLYSSGEDAFRTVYHTWVIPCQINTKKSLPPPIWTKIGSYTVSVETLIHSEFQRSILYGFRVRARQKIDF